MRRCSICKAVKSADQFWKRLARCKDCSRTYDAAWTAKNPGKRQRYARKTHLMSKYGLTHDDYARILATQGGVCAVCGGDDSPRLLAVDHDHVKDCVRGLLCTGCNIAIGLMHDDPERMANAIAYLTRYT